MYYNNIIIYCGDLFQNLNCVYTMDYGYVLKTSDKLGISIFHHRMFGRYHNIYTRTVIIIICISNKLHGK